MVYRCLSRAWLILVPVLCTQKIDVLLFPVPLQFDASYTPL